MANSALDFAGGAALGFQYFGVRTISRQNFYFPAFLVTRQATSNSFPNHYQLLALVCQYVSQSGPHNSICCEDEICQSCQVANRIMGIHVDYLKTLHKLNNRKSIVLCCCPNLVRTSILTDTVGIKFRIPASDT
jgi:hypothetical protein